jgi:hypothetical protein
LLLPDRIEKEMIGAGAGVLNLKVHRNTPATMVIATRRMVAMMLATPRCGRRRRGNREPIDVNMPGRGL